MVINLRHRTGGRPQHRTDLLAIAGLPQAGIQTVPEFCGTPQDRRFLLPQEGDHRHIAKGRGILDMAQRQHIQIGVTGLAGLAQEIRMVLATRKGSVPLDRDFGLSWDHVDRPMGEAMQYMVAEIGQQLERYVPRIRVRDISFSSNDAVDGQLIPRVTVEIREEYRGDFQ